MPFETSAANNATANLPGNAGREGDTVYISPTEAFGSIAADAWLRVGYFDPADSFYPTTNTNTEQLKAKDPNGGPDIVLAEEVTEATAVYDSIAPLTPSREILALHVGAPSTPLTGDLAGGTISPFTIGASILARMIVIKRRSGPAADRPQKVFWHPRVGLQSAGNTQKQNRDVPQFRVPILAWNGVFKTDLSAYESKKSALGAVFTIPDDKLDTLLMALADEAASA